MADYINLLNDDELTGVTGGMVVKADETLPEYNPLYPWEVVDNNNCRCLGQFATQDGACAYAKRFGPDSYNKQLTDIATVQRLRANPNTF